MSNELGGPRFVRCRAYRVQEAVYPAAEELTKQGDARGAVALSFMRSFSTYECLAPKECEVSELCAPAGTGACKTPGRICGKDGICKGK
jgi:hypothetical protein